MSRNTRKTRSKGGRPVQQHIVDYSSTLIEEGPMRKVFLVAETCRNCGEVVATYERVFDYSLSFEAAVSDIPVITLPED